MNTSPTDAAGDAPNTRENMKPKTRKPQDLDLSEWQELVDKFKASPAYKSQPVPVAMRIEGTQFTTARYAGGCTYNGHAYTYFESKISGHEPNPDGTPYVAWLLVRADFLKWVQKELKKQAKGDGDGKTEEQTMLNLKTNNNTERGMRDSSQH